MRLVQISRKLDIQPSYIAKYLIDTGDASINFGPNTKISEEQVTQIISHFSHLNPENDPKSTNLNDLETKKIDYSYFETQLDPELETIKAPKVDLQGITVIGKIDLPQKKQAAPSEQTEETSSEKENTTNNEKKVTRVHKKHTKKQHHKKILSYEEQLKQEQESYQKSQEKKKKQEKHKKKEYYNTIVKTQQAKPTTPKKKTKAQIRKIEIQQIKRKEEENKPTTLWGKFMKWLNT